MAASISDATIDGIIEKKLKTLENSVDRFKVLVDKIGEIETGVAQFKAEHSGVGQYKSKIEQFNLHEDKELAFNTDEFVKLNKEFKELENPNPEHHSRLDELKAYLLKQNEIKLNETSDIIKKYEKQLEKTGQKSEQPLGDKGAALDTTGNVIAGSYAPKHPEVGDLSTNGHKRTFDDVLNELTNETTTAHCANIEPDEFGKTTISTWPGKPENSAGSNLPVDIMSTAGSPLGEIWDAAITVEKCDPIQTTAVKMKPGDTVWKLTADHYNLTDDKEIIAKVDEVLARNEITKDEAKNLSVGTTIIFDDPNGACPVNQRGVVADATAPLPDEATKSKEDVPAAVAAQQQQDPLSFRV